MPRGLLDDIDRYHLPMLGAAGIAGRDQDVVLDTLIFGAGRDAGVDAVPRRDQDRLIVWMKRENSSPCEPICSLA